MSAQPVPVALEAATKVKLAVEKNGGKTVPEGKKMEFDFQTKKESLTGQQIKETLLLDLPSALKQLDSLRAGNKESAPIDISLPEFLNERFGFAPTEKKYKLRSGAEQSTLVAESFFNQIGLNANYHTVASLNELGNQDEGFRWLIPEIYTDAIRLGLRRNPIWGDLVRAEENVSQLKVSMPQILMAAMTPAKLGEAESIPAGTIQFDQKDVKLQKLGLGIDITDEAASYVPLNLIALALEDFGVMLSMGIDSLAIRALINGDQADGSDSVALVGTANGTSVTYKDILKMWIRMSRIGQLPSILLSGEDLALDVLDLDEFKGFAGDTRLANLNLKTPRPQQADYYIHGEIPDDQLLFVNPEAALIKLNAQALRTERDRNPSRQITTVVVSLTTGFATLKRDARLLLDRTEEFASSGFPTWMDVDTVERVTFK